MSQQLLSIVTLIDEKRFSFVSPIKGFCLQKDSLNRGCVRYWILEPQIFSYCDDDEVGEVRTAYLHQTNDGEQKIILFGDMPAVEFPVLSVVEASEYQTPFLHLE